jgi:hypothetical protein
MVPPDLRCILVSMDAGAAGRGMVARQAATCERESSSTCFGQGGHEMHIALIRHRPNRRRVAQLLLGGTVAGLSLPAVAHHGWSWAEDQQTELRATIVSISMAPPHPSLRVKAADGVLWQIELGNPSLTERSGFTATSAKPGDPVTILGNRHKDKTRMQMKAVRITIAGKNYDMYPERIRTN